MCSVYKIWQKRKIHINTDFKVTGWVLCVVPHMRKKVKYHSDSDNRKHVNNVIKKLFHEVPEYEMDVTQGIFWTEYTKFYDNNGSFDVDEFIWKSKYIRDGNSHLWHQNYSLPCTKVLGFVACIVKWNVLGIGAAERSWGEVKTIKSGKISAISSDLSDKQIIVYTSACTESARIEQCNSNKQFNENVSSHT